MNTFTVISFQTRDFLTALTIAIVVLCGAALPRAGYATSIQAATGSEDAIVEGASEDLNTVGDSADVSDPYGLSQTASGSTTPGPNPEVSAGASAQYALSYGGEAGGDAQIVYSVEVLAPSGSPSSVLIDMYANANVNATAGAGDAAAASALLSFGTFAYSPSAPNGVYNADGVEYRDYMCSGTYYCDPAGDENEIVSEGHINVATSNVLTPQDYTLLSVTMYAGVTVWTTCLLNTECTSGPSSATASADPYLVIDSSTPCPGCTLVLSEGIGNAAPVPEPEIYAMMMAGLGLVGVVVRSRKQA